MSKFLLVLLLIPPKGTMISQKIHHLNDNYHKATVEMHVTFISTRAQYSCGGDRLLCICHRHPCSLLYTLSTNHTNCAKGIWIVCPQSLWQTNPDQPLTLKQNSLECSITWQVCVQIRLLVSCILVQNVWAKLRTGDIPDSWKFFLCYLSSELAMIVMDNLRKGHIRGGIWRSATIALVIGTTKQLPVYQMGASQYDRILY